MVTVTAATTAEELNTVLIKLRSDKDWTGAYEIIEPLVLDVESPLHAWALMQLAITEWAQSPRAVLSAMRHTDQAFQLLAGQPALQARTVVQGLNCAWYAEDTDRYRTYANAGRVLLDRGGEECHPWHARILIWLGYHFEDTGRPNEAGPCYTLAVKAGERYGSPFSPDDALCQMRLALTALGDLHLRQGRVPEAVVALRRALAIPLPGRRGDIEYLLGRLASCEGRFGEAVQKFNESLRKATECRDHVLVMKGSEALAYALRDADRREEIASRMQSVIHDAAYAELDHVVNRLQRLVRNLTS